MKRRILVMILFTAILSFILLIHFIPISFELGSCSGGYKSYIVEKYENRYYQLFESYNKLKKDNYEVLSSLDEIKSTADITGEREMTVKIKYRVKDKLLHVTYKGKKIWLETYIWKIADIKTI